MPRKSNQEYDLGDIITKLVECYKENPEYIKDTAMIMLRQSKLNTKIRQYAKNKKARNSYSDALK